jgi:uncharacterized protein (UPF0179 family)
MLRKSCHLLYIEEHVEQSRKYNIVTLQESSLKCLIHATLLYVSVDV